MNMEFMKRILAIFGFIVAAHFDASYSQHAISNNVVPVSAENEELRRTLNTVLDQNRRLTLQNNRLQQVWSGMEQMCKALSMPTCNCGQAQGVNKTNDPALPTKRVVPMHVMSVKSSGNNMNRVSISIKYTATPDHTTEWIVLRTNDGMWRTVGQRTEEIYDTLVYTSTVDVLNWELVHNIYFRLYTDEESSSVQLNITAMDINQEQDVVKQDVDLLKISKSFVAPRDSSLVISSIVNRNPNEFYELAHVEVFFTGLNTSASPPTIFEITHFNSDGLGLSGGRHTNTTSYMNITLRQPYVRYGGILSVRMPYITMNASMVEKIFYGPFIRIYRPDGNNVIQNNTMGIFPLDRQTVVFPSNHSIMCAAMGNPRPEVSIFKMTEGGIKTDMTTETVISDSYMNMEVMTLSAVQPEQTEGRYFCQATNGNQTINVSTEAIVLEPAVFTMAKTGVTTNTSQSIVISCEAKGKPKPILQLKLYFATGPDLIKSGMYRVWRSEPNMFTSRVTLTLSPVADSDIHTIYCTSTQGGPSRSYEDSKEINVYPGLQKRDNWVLYDKLLNVTQNAYNG